MPKPGATSTRKQRRGAGSRAPARAPRRWLAGAGSAFAATVIAGAFYLLLIDTLDLPELYAGAAVVLLSVLIFVAARGGEPARSARELRLLPRAWRLALRVPADCARVGLGALMQLLPGHAHRGVLRAVPFRYGSPEAPEDVGRRGLAEVLGSLGPNTIVIGIDRERNLLLVHQLRRAGEASAIDLLDAG